MEQNENKTQDTAGKGILMTLAGEPPVGDNTTIMLHLVSQAALVQHTPAAYFSPGMTAVEVINRLIAVNTGIDYKDIAAGTLSDEDWKKLDAELPKLTGAPLYIDDTQEIPLSDLSEKIVDLAKSKGVQIVAVDPVSKVAVSVYEAKQDIVDYIKASLKTLAEDLGIIIFMAEE